MPAPALPFKWQEDEEFPGVRANCEDRERPCPWVGCVHHTLLDVHPTTGTMTINVGMTKETEAPDDSGRRWRPRLATRRLPSWGMKGSKHDDGLRCDLLASVCVDLERSCVLDMVECEQSYTLEEVGTILNVTRERVRQVEVKGLVTIRAEIYANEKLIELAGRENAIPRRARSRPDTERTDGAE